MEKSYNYNWSLKDANFTKDKGNVFSCFSCGGGSTMGYKLAGFDVIGCNEIDPKMMDAYKANHNPKYSYLEGIQDFKDRKDLPKELYNLDILDGSPPCSSFSTAGSRDKDWGKSKKFREGQAEQVLDTLFFDFIDLAKELQPKVVVAENVKGMLMGKAKEYVKQIYKDFDAAGYYCQHFLLNAADMGVPQRRERVFFICLRKDLAKQFLVQKDMFTIEPKLEMRFAEKPILFKEFAEYGIKKRYPETGRIKKYWDARQPSDINLLNGALLSSGKTTGFSMALMHLNKVLFTLSRNDRTVCYHECRMLTDTEFLKGCTFPSDYNFLNVNKTYLMGMSVPPVMMAKVSEQIYKQWLSKI
jgi:DNA (cytosine-5)-methyltransferase 1